MDSPVVDGSADPVPARARVRGEPYTQLPHDLYIPPEALEVFLDSFEGPLDLLLYLIRRHSLDILDIPMAELTRQYLVYVEAMRARRLELAAEYLVMAAVLIEIKSRMLLPRPPAVAEEDLDPRAELMRRLLEYERMKRAAGQLDALPRAGRDFVCIHTWADDTMAERLPDVSVAELQAAWAAVIARARVNRHHRVGREMLSVREQMARILRRLQSMDFVPFHELFDPAATVPAVVANFIALLELVKEALVAVTQAEAYAVIYVRLAGAPDGGDLPREPA